MKSQNLTQGGILKSLVTFAFPVLLALFLQVMYGAADLIIVGQFAGTGEQSGVASGSQLFHLVTLVITGLTMGVTVLVGNAIGARDPERASPFSPSSPWRSPPSWSPGATGWPLCWTLRRRPSPRPAAMCVSAASARCLS